MRSSASSSASWASSTPACRRATPKPPLPEGCFALVPLAEAAAPLVRLVRDFRPHVILTYDENGGYPHPDHIKTHQVAVEAFEAAADPDAYPEAGGEPWQPLKMYYFVAFHQAKYVALHEELRAPRPGLAVREDLRASGRNAPASAMERGLTGSWRSPPRSTSADYFEIRDDALRAHATQIDPNSSWFACPLDVERAAWPTEDYHLARSLVDTELPEDDLFAGIRESVTL